MSLLEAALTVGVLQLFVGGFCMLSGIRRDLKPGERIPRRVRWMVVIFMLSLIIAAVLFIEATGHLFGTAGEVSGVAGSAVLFLAMDLWFISYRPPKDANRP